MPQPSEPAFAIPQPVRQPEPLTQLSVTAFSDYLECPYRFYLKHVLKLSSLQDDAREMDARMFGTLLHKVLGRFGKSPEGRLSDPVLIRLFLNETLDQCVADQFGADPLVPVRIQVEQLRSRLNAFAGWQARHVAEGWELKHSERYVSPIPFSSGDGRQLLLKGQIDRIDYHPERRSWRLFDYKTSESGKSPEKTHRVQGEWVDLQLPLYRHLARSLGITGRIELGYIVLPKEAGQVDALQADWSDTELEDADERAREVIREILDQTFWPPTLFSSNRPFPSDFAPICQEGVPKASISVARAIDDDFH